MSDKTDPTADELLATLRGHLQLLAFDQFHALCLTGHPPAEYLRALAARAREEAKGMTTFAGTNHLVGVAKTLEAWGDE